MTLDDDFLNYYVSPPTAAPSFSVSPNPSDAVGQRLAPVGGTTEASPDARPRTNRLLIAAAVVLGAISSVGFAYAGFALWMLFVLLHSGPIP